MNLVEARGPHRRRARHRDRRQPDVRRHRPPHLQRLHEGLHLPEAGAGRHSAGRDARAEGRAGAAVGLRDLLAADALESAQPAPAAAEARERPQGAGGRARARRLHARASPDERRPHRRRRRRAQDRAAARRCLRRRRARRARRRSARSAMSPSCASRSTPASWPGFGGVAEYGITVRWDKNFLKLIRLLLERRDAVHDVRRRALRRHAHHRRAPSRSASTTSRSAPAPAGRPSCR